MPTQPRILDAATLSRHSRAIESALRDIFIGTSERNGAPPSAARLQDVFDSLFGSDYQPQDQRRFVLFVAPLMRSIVIEYAKLNQATVDALPSEALLIQRLQRLEQANPQCSRIIDLHYFCGLTPQEIAATLDQTLAKVMRDLRFGQAWVRTDKQVDG